jgi:hypothetical protein
MASQLRQRKSLANLHGAYSMTSPGPCVLASEILLICPCWFVWARKTYAHALSPKPSTARKTPMYGALALPS